VPYLLLGLQDVQWAVGNSRGARKLARTPHVNKKKKKRNCKQNIYFGVKFQFLFLMKELPLINFVKKKKTLTSLTPSKTRELMCV
jgi:hypothetical protein